MRARTDRPPLDVPQRMTHRRPRAVRSSRTGVAVTRRLGVVRESGELAILPAHAPEERVERGAMQTARTGRRDRPPRRRGGELVPERDALARRDEHARGDALVEPARRSGRRASRRSQGLRVRRRDWRQRRVRPARPARAVPCGRGRRREPWPGAHPGRRASTSVTKNGFPWSPVQRQRVEPVPTPQACDRVGRRGDSGHAGRKPTADARSPTSAVAGGPVELVVAIAHDEHGAHPLESACDEPEDVERRLVGPVDVLQEQHRVDARAARRRVR